MDYKSNKYLIVVILSVVRIACIGIGSHSGFVMEHPAEELRKKGYEITLFQGDSVTLDDELDVLQDFLKNVSGCDFIFINAHGDVSFFRHWPNLRDILESNGVSAIVSGLDESFSLQYQGLFLQSPEDFALIRKLEAIGGDENHMSSLKWALKTFDGVDIDVTEPITPMAQGVYVPGKGSFPLEDGLKDIGRKGKPVIAIFFVNVFQLRHNTDAIDVLWEKVLSIGAEPVAIFLKSYEDDMTGNMGVARIIDEHLIRDGGSIVDAVINTMGFAMTLTAKPGTGEQTSDDNFFERLNVPVIQAINLYGPSKEWKDSPFGLSPADIAMSVVDPEYDGQIDSVPYCGTERDGTGNYRQVAIVDRCEAIVEMAYRWAMLRHIPNKEKKVAILIYMYPPRQDLAGGGYGLDTLQSVSDMLGWFRDYGYTLDWMPEDGKELVTRLLEGVTNDDNWKSDKQLREASVDFVSKEQYDIWFSEIAESAQRRFIEAWGETPGDQHILDGKLLLPGIMNGNIFIGFQPDRGKCNTESYHDPWTAPPHQYLAYYRWLKYTWGADAVVHIGTHGTLEWLPGKSVGLSRECDPDIILDRVPNINPYIIDNPGEGMQSKRRQYAITTTHMIPSMARSGGYDEINELEVAVQAYLKAKDFGQMDKLPSISNKVLECCVKLNMLSDLGIGSEPSNEEIDSSMDRLYDYILEVKDALIKDGLHILGDVPESERMDEMIYSLVRYPNGEIPSLRESIGRIYGYEVEDLLRNPSGSLSKGELKGEMIDRIDLDTFRLIESSRKEDFDIVRTKEIASDMFPGEHPELDRALEFMCGFLIDAIRRMGDEIEYVMKALDGGFVPPGPSGCPGRGRAQILPTGRNFYSIDPDGIPWNSSWEIGSKMAEQMVSRYLNDNGSYPKTVGMILWATDTMKTGGDDVAYILRLMGLRPVWAEYGGRVKDIEVIPLGELGRPRIDVTLRISGLFRDTFPNISNMIDRGVQTIAALDEDDEENYLAANVRRDIVESIAQGIPVDEAKRMATYRVFGDAPGTYGCGISGMIESGNWRTVDDLGDSFVSHGCYVYGKGLKGEAQPEMFRRRLKVMDVTVKNHNTRAVDMLDMDDDFDNLGGFNAAVRSIRGEKPVSFMGDSSDTQFLKLRTAEEECRFIFRSKIDNPKWLNGLKKHGFAGAKELSKLFDYTMGWSGTSDIIEGWMYDDLAERFVLDEETREWIKNENPYAMMAMLARLQEAMNRGFWDPDDTVKGRLKDIYIDFEERIEEITDR